MKSEKTESEVTSETPSPLIDSSVLYALLFSVLDIAVLLIVGTLVFWCSGESFRDAGRVSGLVLIYRLNGFQLPIQWLVTGLLRRYTLRPISPGVLGGLLAVILWAVMLWAMGLLTDVGPVVGYFGFIIFCSVWVTVPVAGLLVFAVRR